ncbi:MAG: right-handed parallel beta-helix repeat-containing protein [Armatimonadetes bacterium]|nr:right-handed parallel beta-helix repeat-containing protein [Armatimonadota bacterium]
MFLWLIAGFLGLAALAASGGSRRKLVFYVAPDGNDRWSGTKPRPLANGSDGPFATLEGARNALRELKASEGLSAPVEVRLRGGTYFLRRPFVLRAQDSGTPECPITYCAARGQKPVISGGVPIGGWQSVTVNGKKAWAADLPQVREGKLYFRELWVNGERRLRPRLPRRKWTNFDGLLDVKADTPWQQGQTRARFKPGDIKRWRNLNDVEVVFVTLWRESRLPIASVDLRRRIVRFAKASTTRLTEDFTTNPGRYWVENVFEALDRPGLWYLDRGEGRLYYVPRRGEKPDEAEVIAPRLTHVLEVRGCARGRNPVHDVHFRGLTFSHVEWELPEDQSGASQAAVNVPGAVRLQGAERCSFTDCTVAHVGTYAIEFTKACRDNLVRGCHLHDLGAGGVKIGHGSERTTVSDCVIHDGGHLFPSAVGVWIGDSPDNVVAHNLIHHFYYTGVSVGWTWGYGKSKATGNRVEFNHIHHIGQGVLSDMGGIYTLGVSPGSVLRHNLIHDVESYAYGGWGLYPDEGTSYMLIENNVVYRTKTGGFHQHYGRENIVRNNIFAFARLGQIQRTRVEDHDSFIFQRNIVYWDRGPLLHGNWSEVRAQFDRNVYWRRGGKKFDFAGRTLEQWQELGQDRHSLIADPGFANPEEGDFSLPPDSPALKVGFRPLDVSKVGPRARWLPSDLKE